MESREQALEGGREILVGGLKLEPLFETSSLNRFAGDEKILLFSQMSAAISAF
jgi:hypothetical protein